MPIEIKTFGYNQLQFRCDDDCMILLFSCFIQYIEDYNYFLLYSIYRAHYSL